MNPSLAAEVFAKIGTDGVAAILELKALLERALNDLEAEETPLDFMHSALTLNDDDYERLLRDLAMIEHIHSAPITNDMITADDLLDEEMHITKRIDAYMPCLSSCTSYIFDRTAIASRGKT